jgi:oxygen-independent coproporphyrinogen-3 oxidase
LLSEIEFFEQGNKNILKNSFVDSIYFGGGTPSLIKPDLLKNLLKILESKFNLKEPEITLEANPKSFLKNYNDKRDIFFNRLSLGIVSFQDEELANLNRDNFGYDALVLSKKLGIENVSVDLLMGIPGQTLVTFKESLDTICTFNNVKGVSVYPLEAEFVLPDEVVLEFMMYSKKYLHNEGYIRYEIANYAKDGYFCKHNLKYWKYMNFLSFGPSAASKIGNRRFKRSSNLEAYLSKSFLMEEDIELSTEEEFFEKVMMGLRLMDGIKISELKNRFDRGLVDNLILISKKFVQLVKIEEDSISLTDKGIIFMNNLLVELMPELSTEVDHKKLSRS